MTFQPSDDQLQQLGLRVAEVAYEIFCACDAEADFGMQSPEGAVFGSVNRLRLTKRGWHASEHHCNDEFLKKWREISVDFQPKKETSS